MSASTESTLRRFLEGDYWELKREIRSFIDGNPLFNLRFDLSLDENRKITHERARFLLGSEPITRTIEEQGNNERGFVNKSLALGEVMSTTDLSMGVKMGVMAWLFGGAVTNLGSPHHVERWFYRLKDLEFTGMFCMSEMGHGSNVRAIQTEAHYDPKTQEFVINTPVPDARKMYIGNALNGNYAATFAQLYVGGQSKGPHCFIVPIRREGETDTCPGITVQDLGFKEGLNGVDNGWISFDHVRIPRENLLNRYADVSPEGKYSTSVANDGARFNTMISALLGTRIALCGQALAATKVGLAIAIKYGFRRRQFGPSGQPEQLLMEYQTHQLRLMPRLATALGLTFTSRYMGNMLDGVVHRQENVVDNRDLQALAAGLKAYTTWEAVNTLQVCRECTGGMGYMEENRISSLKRDLDAFVTFEGDNIVMLQQVVKELLTQYGKQFDGSKVKAILYGVKDTLISKYKTSMFAPKPSAVTSLEFIHGALTFKEGELLRTLAARLLNKVGSMNEEPFYAWNDCLDHVIALAWCHVQRVTLEQFKAAVERCPEAEDAAILNDFLQLYAVHILHGDRVWYLEQRYMTPAMSKDIRDEYLRLCQATSRNALTVLDAFCLPTNCLHAPAAGVPNDRAPWAYFPDPAPTPQAKL